MIDMIRVGQARNLLRAPSSPSEIWPRSAHHHLGQRRSSAARTGLTRVRTRSHAPLFRNSLQNERHPQEKVRPQFPPLRQLLPRSGFSAASTSSLKPLETKDFCDRAVDPAATNVWPFSLFSRRFLRRQCTSRIRFNRFFQLRFNALANCTAHSVSSAFWMPKGAGRELQLSRPRPLTSSIGWRVPEQLVEDYFRRARQRPSMVRLWRFSWRAKLKAQ
jgi:hypothetical protein